jgi:membrane protein
VTFAAAAVSYYWLGSLVPIAVLGFVALQSAYGSALVDWTVAQIGAALTPTGHDVLREALLDSTGSVALTVVGVLGLFWGWSRFYGALESAFERIYDADHHDGLPSRAVTAAVVVPAISIGMTLAASGVLTRLPGLGWDALHVLAVALALLPVFVTLSPTRPNLRTAFAGAATTAIVWSGLRYAFDAYASYATTATYSLPYGVLGGLVLFVTFLYLGTLTLLFAGSLTATLDA